MQVGTQKMAEVNRAGVMLIIANLDYERVLLNNKTMKKHLCLQSNVDNDCILNENLWGKLSTVEKTVLIIDNTGELTFNFNPSQTVKGLTNSKPIICVVPYTCAVNSSCKMTINKKSQSMNCSNKNNNARFFNLAYELSPDTKEITIKIEGEPGTLITIKDIQIWQ